MTAPAYLVVNADDFGLTEGTNQAIIDAHRKGIVTSTSLLANGGSFDHAVKLAVDTPTLRIGVHLTLTEGDPIGDAAWLPNHVFPLSNQPYVRALLRARLPVNAIRDEFRAQVRKILAAGVQPTHIDGHKYIHLLPGIAETAAQVAHEFGIPVMRIPRPADPPVPKLRTLGMVALGTMGAAARLASQRYGLVSADRSLGFMDTGHLTADIVRALLARPRAGVTELVCHPAYPNTALDALYAAGYTWIAGYNFAEETAALCNKALLSNGWHLANFSVLTTR